MRSNKHGFPQDQYAEVDGLRLRYWTTGQGQDVLLLHGLGGSVEDWSEAFERQDSQFRLWALDLPGSGRSDKPRRDYSLGFFVRIALRFLDLEGVERAHIIGVSMGGGIGIGLSVEAPAKVHRLVLTNSALLGRRLHPFLHLCALPLLGELLLTPTSKVVERYISWCLADPTKAPSKWVAIRKDLATLPSAKQGFLAMLRSSTTVLGMRRRVLQPIVMALPSLSPETLIICGKQDRFIPTRYGQRAATKIPKAQFVCFPDCGHVPHIECPDLFYPLVFSFLKEGAQLLSKAKDTS